VTCACNVYRVVWWMVEGFVDCAVTVCSSILEECAPSICRLDSIQVNAVVVGKMKLVS
jgi:hypothetical protein